MTKNREAASPEAQYLSARQVRARYGEISDMTLWRWLNDQRMGFPQPIRINGRRLFSLSALEAWERSQAAQRGAA